MKNVKAKLKAKSAKVDKVAKGVKSVAKDMKNVAKSVKDMKTKKHAFIKKKVNSRSRKR